MIFLGNQVQRGLLKSKICKKAMKSSETKMKFEEANSKHRETRRNIFRAVSAGPYCVHAQ